ncbi:Alpha-N-acetylglucosaminidase [Bienertia sinuspersici]
MKVVSWNCRDLGSSDSRTIPFLVWFVRKFQVNVLFLMETHLNGEGFCLYLFRGLTVLWSNQVTLQVTSKCQSFFLCKIEEGCNKQLAQWNLLLLYGSYIANLPQVWEYVSRQLASSPLPCLIQGDFNQIESSDQKWGGTDYILGVQVFKDWKTTWELTDVPFHGVPFTWCNNRDGDNRLYQCLDRATATQDWIQLYPDATMVNFPITPSYHSPIMLNMQPPQQKRRTRIQMNSWSLNFDEVGELIQQHWNYSVTGSPMFSCTSKIKRVRYNMFKWCQSYAKKHHTLWQDLNASCTSAQLGVGTPLFNYTEQTTRRQAIQDITV